MPVWSVCTPDNEQWCLTIVAHGIEIQALQIWQQECVPLRIPGAISDIHGV